MTKPNWNKAPSWANWGATCAVSGNQVWFGSYPSGDGWVDIWPRPGKDDQWRQILPEGYREAESWPKGCAAVVHGRGGVEWIKHPSPEFAWKPEVDHAAELAEALEAVLDRVCSREYDYDDFPNAGKALYKYKQSRGE